MNTIVVLGGTGFLGQHVVRIARQQGHAVSSLSRREGCDVTDRSQFVARLRHIRPDTVINCAAHVGGLHYFRRRAADVVEDNLQIILHLYRGVAQACPQAAVVNPISNCAYPGEAELYCEDQWRNGQVHDSVLPYGEPRRMLYVVAACYARQYSLRSVNWLVPNAYGPGDSTDPEKVHALDGLILRLIQAQRAGHKTFEIWGTGRPVREWCYIEDAARLLVHSVGLGQQIEPLNVAQKQGWSIAEIARLAARALDYDVQFTFNPAYPDGAPIKIMDDQRFRACFPQFSFTPLEAGIRATIAYYRQALS